MRFPNRQSVSLIEVLPLQGFTHFDTKHVKKHQKMAKNGQKCTKKGLH